MAVTKPRVAKDNQRAVEDYQRAVDDIFESTVELRLAVERTTGVQAELRAALDKHTKCIDILTETFMTYEEKNKIDHDKINNKIDSGLIKVKEDIINAIGTRQDLSRHGLHTVTKANTGQYDKANSLISQKIGSANEVKLMCYFGDTDFKYFKDSLITALKRGCKVQTLIVSEESLDICRQFSLDIYNDLIDRVKDAHREVRGLISEIVSAVECDERPTKNYYFGTSDVIKLVENFKIRTYDFWPHNNILIVDENIRFIPYLANRSRGNSLVIFGKVDKDNDNNICVEFGNVFDDVWTKASKKLKEAPK